jgi:hypothetical protein
MQKINSVNPDLAAYKGLVVGEDVCGHGVKVASDQVGIGQVLQMLCCYVVPSTNIIS